MKLIKKLSLSLLIFTVLLSTLPSKSVNAIGIPWAGIAWKVINYVGNTFYDVAGTSESTATYAKVSTGTKHFNDSGYNVGASVKHVVDINKSGLIYDLHADAVWYDFFSTISIIMTDNYNNDIINKSVTSGQWASHTSTYSDNWGRWTVRFVENSHTTWNCWIDMLDSSGKSIIASTPSTQNLNQGILTPNFYKTNDKIYTIPSNDYKKNVVNIENKKLTMKDLGTETLDNATKSYVQSFKSYNSGDKLIFEDRIKEIKYNKENDCTQFTFEGLNGDDVTWSFDKNLTQKYKSGENLKLNLKVLTEYKDNKINVETLDYVQDGIKAQKESKYVDITKYQ